MKITPIAVATIIPAALAGAVLTVMPFAQAAPGQPAPHTAARHATARHSAAPREADATPRHAAHAKTHRRHSHAEAAVAAGLGSASLGSASPGGASLGGAGQAASDSRPGAGHGRRGSAGNGGHVLVRAVRGLARKRRQPDRILGRPVRDPALDLGELGYSGTAGQASVALQKVAFPRLYAEYGAQPWAPSDGC